MTRLLSRRSTSPPDLLRCKTAHLFHPMSNDFHITGFSCKIISNCCKNENLRSVWFIFSLSLSLANTSWQIPNSSSSKKWDNRKVECDATNKRLFAHFTVLEITIWSINKTVQFWWRPKVMYLVYYFHLFGMRIFGVWIERGPIDFSTCLSSTNMYWYCTFRFVFILYKFISI